MHHALDAVILQPLLVLDDLEILICIWIVGMLIYVLQANKDIVHIEEYGLQ